MNPLRVVVAAVGAGALLAGGFLLLRGGGDTAPPRDRLAVAPVVVRPNVLVDAQGAVLEEFTGDCAAGRYPYVCIQAKAELDEDLLRRGGLTIVTAIDQRVQRAAQQGIDRYVRREDAPVAAQAMIAPGTGEIRALAASRALGPGNNLPGGRFGFQQGTTAMVYTLTAALESGMRYDDGFPYAGAYRPANYQTFKNCAGQAAGEPSFTIVNRNRDHGAFTTLRSGTRTAENTFYMKLTEKVGLCESVRVAKRLGLKRADGLPFQEFETFPLGINEVDPVSLAGSYATLAARGRRCEPRLVTEVRSDAGVLRSFPARCEEALEPAVADAVTGVLVEALAKGPLKGLGRDAAGMEGTADSFSTAWYAGYTPDLASAVALGDPRGAVRHKLSDITIGGRRYRHVEGTSIPGPIWKSSMTEALAGSPGTAFAKPDLARFGGCRDHCAP
ncbi:hypothetical protein ABZ912_36945 [Nonomuraea angiospora]|uniref:hypothetical protein n=1 Tax=Nonomuraea angiospora TaxID=46172 RepID=UPI0033F6DF24